jgi:pyruvate,water dikinase
VHKDTLEILNINIAQKDTALCIEIGGDTKWIDVSPERVSTQSLSDNQLVKLVKTVKLIEEYFDSPSDIEWAYERGALHILQSRPITA